MLAVAGDHHADQARVGHRVLAHQASTAGCAALEVLDRRQQRDEVPQRALAGVRRAGVGGCAHHRELERQCPGGRRHQGPGRRLGDDTRVGVVAASRVAKAPRPPSSSPTTKCRAAGRSSRMPAARTARIGARLATRPPSCRRYLGLRRSPDDLCPEGVRRPGAQLPGGTTSTCAGGERGDAVARLPRSPQLSARSLAREVRTACRRGRSRALRSTSVRGESRSANVMESLSAPEPDTLGMATSSCSSATMAASSMASRRGRHPRWARRGQASAGR